MGAKMAPLYADEPHWLKYDGSSQHLNAKQEQSVQYCILLCAAGATVHSPPDSGAALSGYINRPPLNWPAKAWKYESSQG